MDGIAVKIWAFLFEIIETVVVALALFVVIYLFLAQPHQVRGASMAPNFHNGEYILTDKITYKFRKPERGDVIIFRAPKNQELDYIKRIIALPGETVKVEKGSIFVNGKMIEEKYLPSGPISPGTFLQEGQGVTLEQDEYFVLGDNRNHSSDSREWGPITIKDIIGKAFLRYWPVDQIRFIVHPTY